jgi:hypothetical protein
LIEEVEIFKRRLLIDARRQPAWQKVLVALDQWLAHNPPCHPYGRNDYPLCPVSQFADVCKGPPVNLDRCEFLYRISAIGSVIRSANSEKPFCTNSPELNWDILRADQLERNSWLPLSNYITGALPGRRDFTWWTPFDLAALPVLPNAHRIGMPNNWISPYALILRLNVRGLDIGSFGRVPTVIDGFDSPIFYATLEGNASIGMSIDLRIPASLQLGEFELVTDSVSSADVEVLPVHLGEEHRKRYPVDEEAIMAPLLKYYVNLGA